MTTFYERYVNLCAKKDVSLSAAAESVGLSRTSPHGWKKGKIPTDTTIAKLAEYFKVSFFYLKSGEPDSSEVGQKENPTASGEVDYSDMELLAKFKAADETTQELIRRALGLK